VEKRVKRGDYLDFRTKLMAKHNKMTNAGNLGFEAELFKAADKLRGNDDGEPFDKKMKRLTAQWYEQQKEALKLDAAIAANLKELGYGL
jgi:hypothetical protein